MDLEIDVKKVMFLIRENKKFLDYFVQIKEIESDLFSYMANEECSCRFKIQKFIEENVPLINKIINRWKERETDWESIVIKEHKDTKEENTKVKENIKKIVRKTSQDEKEIMGTNNDGLSRNLVGKMIEQGAVAQNYKDMISFGENNKWRYNGVCVVSSTTKRKGQTYLIYKNFFY